MPYRVAKVPNSQLCSPGHPTPLDLDLLTQTGWECCASPVWPGADEEVRGVESRLKTFRPIQNPS